MAEAGLAPCLLAEQFGEAVLELADAGGEPGGPLVGGEQVGLQRGAGDGCGLSPLEGGGGGPRRRYLGASGRTDALCQ